MNMPGARARSAVAGITEKAEKVVNDTRLLITGIGIIALAALFIAGIALIKQRSMNG